MSSPNVKPRTKYWKDSTWDLTLEIDIQLFINQKSLNAIVQAAMNLVNTPAFCS